MAASASPSEMECSCPVCCDIFTDPVVLLCGHSFCKTCLREWWSQSGLQTCPVCKQTFPLALPPRNLALRNLSDALRLEKKTQRASGAPEELCALHGERFKLYCGTDQQLICVICRDAQKHKKHNCVPIEEAVDTCRAQLKLKRLHLKTKQKTFMAHHLQCGQMADHIKLQAQQTEKTIKEEFQRVHQFLRAEEAARIDAVRKEAKFKSVAMEIRIINLTAEISSLEDKIKAIQKEMKADDISLMLNAKSTMERFQCSLPDPQTPTGALLDEAKHLGNLLFTVWKKTKNIIKYTPVSLDPNTGGSRLTISEHMTRLTTSDKQNPLPQNPERMDCLGVLGSEGFISGKHSWDVEVGGYWKIGVAARTKDHSSQKVWAIYMCVCTTFLYELNPETSGKLISKRSFPQKVNVQLDYDQGILSFFDLDRKILVCTIKCTFTEMVFPYFSEKAKILPAEFSVRIRQPR